MKQLSFRRRLTVWSMLVVAVSIVICGAVAAFVIHHSEIEELDGELRAEGTHFYSELERHGGVEFDWQNLGHTIADWRPPVDPPRFLEVRTGGTLRWRSPNVVPPGLGGYAPGSHGIEIGGERYRLFVQEDQGTTFAIAASVAEADELIGDLALALLAGLPVALAFAWLGGRRLAALAVEPVEEMTNATELITAEHLDQRVPVPTVNDEIQRLARVLNATLDRLELSYRQALRFSADASHELKTPLTVLRTSIEALLDSPALSESDRGAISGLLEQTQRLTNITSSLLLLARADTGRLTLDLAGHDLSAITEACAEDARIISEGRGITLECELQRSAFASVDALRFSQIVCNLLDNAVKYNRDGGQVRVTLAADGAMWRLAVANTGPGIPPEHQPRLFERFFRAEHTAGEGGQGLGLSLARELARAHGGDVALVRSEAVWTEFAITLPKNGAIGAHRAAEPFQTMKHTIAIATLALALAGCASNEAQLAARAKVTRAQAETTALKRVPGGTVLRLCLAGPSGPSFWADSMGCRRRRASRHISTPTPQKKDCFSQTYSPTATAPFTASKACSPPSPRSRATVWWRGRRRMAARRRPRRSPAMATRRLSSTTACSPKRARKTPQATRFFITALSVTNHQP